ncbi:hypothetical protein C0J52_08798 [Blattella germanica]|nr:hypothetical protein C0J52_08798 [Blattella germanica]
MDIFMWGHLKHNLYSMKPATIDELRASIERECAEMPIEMIENIFDSISQRCQLCMDHNGQQFDHFQ